MFHHIVDVAHTVGRQGIAFRGKDEMEDSLNRGNFREFVKMKRRTNGDFDLWMGGRDANATYLSAQTQNELIDCFGKAIATIIAQEIEESSCFSICINETLDVSKTEQVSFCVRYVDKKGNICEQLLNMTGINSTNSAMLLNRVKEVLRKRGLKFKNIISQSYDGASTMSGKLTGLQTRVRELNPEAVYVWCNAHRLNLVVEDICKEVPCLEHIFSVLGSIATWFSR
jgi:hypothetical protein